MTEEGWHFVPDAWFVWIAADVIGCTMEEVEKMLEEGVIDHSWQSVFNEAYRRRASKAQERPNRHNGASWLSLGL